MSQLRDTFDRRNVLVISLSVVITVICLTILILGLARPMQEKNHQEKMARIKTCQQADNVSDCLRINR